LNSKLTAAFIQVCLNFAQQACNRPPLTFLLFAGSLPVQRFRKPLQEV